MEKDLGSGLTKPATIVMLAEFENGRATITMRAQQRRRSDEALARNVQATGEVPSRAQRRKRPGPPIPADLTPARNIRVYQYRQREMGASRAAMRALRTPSCGADGAVATKGACCEAARRGQQEGWPTSMGPAVRHT